MTAPAERPVHAPSPARAGLRIGIDGTCLASGRGYGRFLREVLPHLVENDEANRYVLFLDRESEAEVSGLRVEVRRPETSRSQARAASARGSRSLADLWRMGRAVAREPLDLMYFPSVYSYFPVLSRVPVAVSFHDTIAERYGRTVFPSLLTRLLWKAKVALALRQARGVLTVSEWSRDALADWFGIPREHIYVTVEAPSPAFGPVADARPRRAWLRERGLDADAPYLIYVGGFNPHKNLVRLVDAFAEHLRKQPESGLWLLLVGDWAGDVFHADVEGLRTHIERAGVAGRVHFAGFVPDDELRHLYAGALAAALVSLEEGFGLPAVEAAACGVPCIATRNSPLPQLLDGGGIFLEPTDVDGLRDAVDRLVADDALRARLAAGALVRVRALSWSATADALREALVCVAQGRAR